MATLTQWDVLAQTDPAAAAKLLQSMKGKIVVPHAGGQREVAASDARFRILRAGRRWGKTKISAREAVREAVAKPDRMIWWVSNFYKNTRRGYRQVIQQIPPGMFAKPPPPATANELVIHLTNGTVIEFYSAQNPDAMTGEGVHFVVVDEAAQIPGEVWSQIIRPTLMDTQGRAMIVSTPRGRNWFWTFDQRGQDPAYPTYASWHFTSFDNPYIEPGEEEEARRDMPDILFRQEHLAEYLENAATIFDLEKAREVGAILPHPGPPTGHVVLGIDLAKHEDYSVISGANPDRQTVHLDRFNALSWPVQKERIVETYQDLLDHPGVEHVTIGLDSTGIGDVVFDDLDDQGLDVEPVVISNAKKHGMVKLFAASLEQGRATITEDMVDEFRAFEYQITPSGNFTYGAPEGQHDDIVMAKLIEHWTQVHGGAGDVHVYTIRPDQDDEPHMVEDENPTPIVRDSPQAIMARDDAWTGVRL